MSPCLPPPSHRAMAHYDCEVKAVLGQAVIFLKSPEERDNIVAILIITEVSPFRPCLTSAPHQCPLALRTEDGLPSLLLKHRPHSFRLPCQVYLLPGSAAVPLAPLSHARLRAHLPWQP